MMSIQDLKDRLRDVPGIDGLTMQTLLGRQVFGFNGLIAATDPMATEQEIEDAIRNAAALGIGNTMAGIADAINGSLSATTVNGLGASSALIPAVDIAGPDREPKTMTTPAPGSFAASLRAMMDEARTGIEQARADGLARVSDAVAKLGAAKAATAQVAGSMARTIEQEADAVMAELGQISNMGPE